MKLNKKLFFTSLAVLTAMLIIVAGNLSAVQTAVGMIYDMCISSFGWFFVLTNLVCLGFSLWIVLGPYKNVRLGGEGCKPKFNTVSWAGMMFTTSCGAWLIVYGFLEPIYCAVQPPFQLDPLSTSALEYGQTYAHFHWGPNAWCIYVPISIAIGYAIYNRHTKGTTISSVCASSVKSKSWKVIGFFADLFAVCGSVIAPVISIGTGMPLLVALIEVIFNIDDSYRMLIQIAVLLIWVAIFGTSVILGLQKGIKKLSNINISLAFIFMLFFGILAGLFKVFAAEINSIGLFIQNYIRMATYTDPYGSGSFVKGWTIGYWACYFVYMPLMGVFNAKISQGRRLKEIALGQLILCSLGCWVAMATFGNFSMNMQISGKVDVAAYVLNGDEAGAVIAIIDQLPYPKIVMAVLLIIMFIFLATTMDSSSFSAAEMTVIQEKDDALAPRWLRIVWAVAASLIAFVLCQIGGAKAVRSLCYITGLPLAIITYIVIYSAAKMLRDDKKSKK